MDLLIGKSVKYAASKASATTETATSPDLLRQGAVGIYYKASDGLLTLVTAANSLANLVSGADTTADNISYTFAVGSDTSAYVTKEITPADVKRFFAKEYAVASRQISYVGYDGVDASKDLQIIGGTGTNGAIVNYDEASLGFETRFNESAPVEDKSTVSATLMAVDNKVVVASKLSVLCDNPKTLLFNPEICPDIVLISS